MISQIEDDTGTLPPSLPRGVAPEVAAENADVQAIIVPRLTMLMEIANTFLTTIIESMETVPYGIRWICKQIRSLTRVGILYLGECVQGKGEWRWIGSRRDVM
jgi:Ras GTPase-activating-like protein IQGAP2/3